MARLPCYLAKGPLKRGFLGIYLSTFFGVCNFKNTSAMRVIFFFKCSKLNLDFENAKKKKKKIEKKSFVYEIIESEDVAIKYLY